jgi:UDP-galactopyranose mutase
MKQYDYLIVGAGLYGAVFAYRANKAGKKVLLIDRRNHMGGNIYCEKIEDINVHKYGAHIFHTSNKEVWDFVNSFVVFNRYTNSPIANYKGRLFNLPFNMNTFYTLWGTKTPEEAKAKIAAQVRQSKITAPSNFEEQAISLVGSDIYEILIKGYTEKQWGRKAKDLPSFIIKRLPVRFTYDNNYFNDTYQGIPIGGYNKLIDGLLKGIEVRCEQDFFSDRSHFENLAKTVLYTGKIDEYHNYCFGELEYRSLKFEHEIIDTRNYQGNAVMNFTDSETPYTRILEHKHFEFGQQERTVITREFSTECKDGIEPYYPINDEKNNLIYQKYKDLSLQSRNVVFGGRLAEYKYYDMHQIVENCLKLTLPA